MSNATKVEPVLWGPELQTVFEKRSRELAKEGLYVRLLDLQRAYGILMGEIPSLMVVDDFDYDAAVSKEALGKVGSMIVPAKPVEEYYMVDSKTLPEDEEKPAEPIKGPGMAKRPRPAKKTATTKKQAVRELRDPEDKSS